MRDTLSFVFHFERLRVITRSVTHFTRHIYVWQEVHLDFQNAVPFTRLTSSTLHVETEAVEFFQAVPKIKRKLQTIKDVGLGYVTLGQSATTLSGGEAQRMKLASELQRVSTGNTFYVLDEPTTGLHTDDIARLLEVLNRLVEAGNTVLVIEHNLDVIKTADYIIDMGPEGGSGGGLVIATGTPEEVSKDKNSHTGRYLKRALEAAASHKKK